jgi:hypothetical protein
VRIFGTEIDASYGMNIFGNETQGARGSPLSLNGHSSQKPTVSAFAPALFLFPPQNEPATAALTDDAIIQRFEALLVHGPRNIKFLKTLGDAYARKMMFDKSLSLYQRALEIAGGRNAAIESAIDETALRKLDLELNQMDPQSPEHAAQCKEDQRLELQLHAKEQAR